jgi:hypothetical protein
MDDLGIAHERMYVAALRFCRAFERDEINNDSSGGMSVGVASGLLSEAAQRHSDAYKRCEDSGYFGSSEDEHEAA